MTDPLEPRALAGVVGGGGGLLLVRGVLLAVRRLLALGGPLVAGLRTLLCCAGCCVGGAVRVRCVLIGRCRPEGRCPLSRSARVKAHSLSSSVEAARW